MNNQSIRLPLRQIAMRSKQSGAVLVIALIFLLVLTTLAVSNMREVALESRITGTLVSERACFNAGEAGLRDGEYRIAGKINNDGPGSYPSIPIAKVGNAYVLNQTNALESCPDNLDLEVPCIIDRLPQEITFEQAFDPTETGYAGVKQYSPDADTSFDQNIAWYGIPILGGAVQAQSENPEYGNTAAGIGPVRHEVNARAVDDNSCEVRLRSTTLRVYL